MKGTLKASLAVAAIAVTTAACGSSYGSSSASSPAANGTAPATSGDGTVAAAASPLGHIVVDGSGQTLYLFQNDKGAASSCYGACAAAWPPLLTSGRPVAGQGATASLLGTARRSDGTTQVTYAGHPLYRFEADTAPGQTTGQGSTAFGAAWYVLSSKGAGIETGGAPATPAYGY